MRTLLLFLLSIVTLDNANAQYSFRHCATPPGGLLKSITFANSMVGYACGDSGVVLGTSTGGSSWQTLASGTSQHLWDIAVIPNTEGKQFLTIGDGSTVQKSTDGGKTFSSLTIPFQSGSFVFGIQCRDTMNFTICGGDFGIGSGAVATTSDGGSTWKSLAVPGSLFSDKVWMFDNGEGFVVGLGSSGTDGVIHKISKDGSVNLVHSAPGVITNLWCQSPKDVLVIGDRGQVWISSDGGTTWEDHSINLVMPGTLYDVHFFDARRGYVCGGIAEGNLLYTTTDGGFTWAEIPYTFNSIFHGITVIDNHLFVCGDSSRIITADIPATTAVTDATPQEGITVSSSSTSLHIVTQSLAGGSPFRILLCDYTGRICKDYSFSSSCSLTTNELPMGVYYYSLYSSSGIPIRHDKILVNGVQGNP